MKIEELEVKLDKLRGLTKELSKDCQKQEYHEYASYLEATIRVIDLIGERIESNKSIHSMMNIKTESGGVQVDLLDKEDYHISNPIVKNYLVTLSVDSAGKLNMFRCNFGKENITSFELLGFLRSIEHSILRQIEGTESHITKVVETNK